jgi:hypothetical protein
MKQVIRTADSKGRICLPRSFANATVIVDKVSEVEVRIRKAQVIPESEVRFVEEVREPLTDRDRDRFLELLDHPLEPNEALKKILDTHAKSRG